MTTNPYDIKGNPLFAFANGLMAEYEALIWIGSRDSVSNNDYEDLWGAPESELVRVSSDSTMEILSSDAADTSTGSGARSVFVQGVNDKFEEISEIVTLNGTTPVTLANGYFRINLLYVWTFGTSNTNVGDITARTPGGDTQDFIFEGRGISHSSHYTVPVNYYLTVVAFTLSSDSNRGAAFRSLARIRKPDDTEGPLIVSPGRHQDGDLVDHLAPAYLPIPPKSEFWQQARADQGNNTSANINLEAYRRRLF